MASTAAIPEKFRPMFPYPKLNDMQSTVLNDVLFSDKNIVICAPTGSGKTVILELALVRTLEYLTNRKRPSVVYLSPLKSLCQERVDDWKEKSEKIGFTVNQLTGDNDDNINSEIDVLNSSDLLCSTPEKFDWLLRRYRHLFEHVRLLLVDEVHTIGEENRGPTLEALITRMKMFKFQNGIPPPRFVAVSATIPNVSDIGQWFAGDHKVYSFGDEHRAVPLDKVVIGYIGTPNAFGFDRMLNDFLPEVLHKYSDNKPTIVFCMSRKSTESSASSCASGLKLPISKDPDVVAASTHLQEKQLAQLVLRGTAFHHAGLCPNDRQTIETLFLAGKIAALCSTSTLAIGVNLPAHLVVIKSTQFCTGPMGAPEELSDTTFLQMIGRAGRPQFDTSGRAVVLTRDATQSRYRSLMASGTQIESSLYNRIGEQMNAELNLKSINSILSAIEWMKQTFLFVRLSKNVSHYQQITKNYGMTVEHFLANSVKTAIDEMSQNELITLAKNAVPELKPTGYGRLMARQCMSLETMKLIMQKSSVKDISVIGLVDLVTGCSDLAQTMLRNDEVEELLKFNKLIKYPLKDISGKEAKISILLQMAIGCVKADNQYYENEARRILRIAYRVAACFLDTIHLRGGPSYSMLLNASLFFRAMRTEIWEDSPFVSKQIRGIGVVYSGLLASAGLTNFDALVSVGEKIIEEICDRQPPFGANVVREALSVPKYAITVAQLPSDAVGSAQLLVTVKMLNVDQISEHSIRSPSHKLIVLVGQSQGEYIVRLLAH